MQRENLWLHDSTRCPYCVRVRRFLDEIGETVELKDTMMDRENLLELVRATGRQTVPCLKIEAEDGSIRWLHESADIIEYLRGHFEGATESEG
jgi:glutathione S-transferase